MFVDSEKRALYPDIGVLPAASISSRRRSGTVAIFNPEHPKSWDSQAFPETAETLQDALVLNDDGISQL